MAITRGLGRLFLDLARRDGWSGSVLQLGRQTVYLTEREARGSFGLRARVGSFIDDQTYFRQLGFSEIVSCDLDRAGGADLALDLNSPIPDHLRGRYDTVFDGGTLGCVFDVPQALRGMEQLLRDGGRAVHTVASNGYVDDIFFTMSPRLLHDWYSGRGFTVEHFLIIEHSRRWARSRMRAHLYEPGAVDHLTIGGFEQGALLSVVVARKPSHVVDAVPYLRPTSRATSKGPLVRRLLPLVRPILPSRVVRLWPRRMPPSGGRW
ncbi:MAG: hypothetical protein QOC92_464 [Acidimicrobiaceae bacterium]